MADTKLSALTELAATPASDDELYIRDVSEAAVDESKRITVANLVAAGAVTATSTTTFTNKRVTKRIGTVADSATPTPAGDDVDMFTVTALAQAATFGAPTGTPTNGQSLVIRILDNGTARALAWNAIYVARGVALPTTTVLSKYLYVGFFYNSAVTKWDCVASVQEA